MKINKELLAQINALDLLNVRDLYELLVLYTSTPDESEESTIAYEKIDVALADKDFCRELDDLIEGYAIEVQKDGFEFGFKTAVSLLTGGVK